MKIVQFSTRLLWSQIKEMYPNEWVLLSDVDWPSSSATPRRATVVDHNVDRVELVNNQKSDQVVLFIGSISSSVIQFDVHGIAA